MHASLPETLSKPQMQTVPLLNTLCWPFVQAFNNPAFAEIVPGAPPLSAPMLLPVLRALS